MDKKKNTRITLIERKRILEKYDQLPPMTVNAAACLLNVSAALLRVWLRKRNNSNPQKPLVSHKIYRLEAALWKWIDCSRADGDTLNDTTISSKARDFATEIGLCKFLPNAKWLKLFKSREAFIRANFQISHRNHEPKHQNNCTEPQNSSTCVPNKTHQLEAVLWRCIDRVRQGGVEAPMDESTIRVKAARLARMMGMVNFRATSIWFKRFKNREGEIRAKFHVGNMKKTEMITSHKKLLANKTQTCTRTQKLEGVLWKWINLSCNRGIRVNDGMICSEATRLARTMGFRGFRSTTSWLKRFKNGERFQQLQQNLTTDQNDSASRSNCHQSDGSTGQSDSESEALSVLDIPQLDPTVVTAELNDVVHTVTVPSLWQMKEAMKTLATGLLYRGFCDFKLLHQFEKEVDSVLRRSLPPRKENSSHP
ncbi:hypothetical protein DNTS_006426 [Danionella cerebrum]|uniref:HTH CENPB-type domain-containing protein n=1 Tax=Danionella cerebrum TaxID=2873325 RepID=A0A553NLL1_9TELE|nr:hypothetical protein DNTS_006426 [Danionella translucida]